MKFRLLFTVLLLGIFGLPQLAFAHSVLVSIDPSNSKPVAAEVSELKLQFNTSIEPLSSLKVKDEDGKTYPISKTSTDGEFLTATLKNPLRDGKYTVDWRIIGADGHAIKGSYALEIRIPESSPSPTESPVQSAPTSTPAPSVITDNEQPDVGAEAESAPLETSNLTINTILVGSALLLLVIVFYIRAKKKK